MTATPEQIIEALRPVEDPELHRSIVDLGMVRDVAVTANGVSVGRIPVYKIDLSTAAKGERPSSIENSRRCSTWHRSS